MGRRKYQGKIRKTAWVGGAVILLCLTACGALWNAPESRALDFIETLVTAPEDTQKLRDIARIAPDRNPEDLLDGLSARVALAFLRAKQVQGVTLKFALGDVRRIDAARRTVAIRVTYPEPETPANGEVRLQVQARKDDQGQWHITRVTGGN